MAGLALIAATGCQGGDREPVHDVILVTIDTLRADRIGLLGDYARDTSPRIDDLFADGIVYEHSYSTEASTSPSMVSVLSGLLPQDHRVRLFYQLVPEETKILPDLLPENYQTAAFVSNMVLTDEAVGWGDRFDHFDDFVDQREPLRPVWERDADRTTTAVLDWLATHRDPDRPLFLWVHYIDPHGPYAPPTDWGLRFKSEEVHTIPIERVPSYQREPGLTDGNAYIDR
jgi:arylsulfatase